jgi:hypothetical protein
MSRLAAQFYPMLIGVDGRPRTAPESRRLSNRTFLRQDSRGRIVVGTTRDAFFSLARLGPFLKAAPLDLRLALNPDGGAIARQSVRLKGSRGKPRALSDLNEPRLRHGERSEAIQSRRDRRVIGDDR